MSDIKITFKGIELTKFDGGSIRYNCRINIAQK